MTNAEETPFNLLRATLAALPPAPQRVLPGVVAREHCWTSLHRRPRQTHRGPPEGFTLLEVMVAVSILALALTAIFASSGGAVGATQRVKQITVATMLARCKMVEIEQTIRLEGFQVADVDEEGPCCEDEEEPEFTCHYKVESIELPDVSVLQSAAGALSSGDPLGMGAALGGPSPPEGAPPEDGASDAMGAGMMAGLNILYPMVSNVLQASIRRVTVEAKWKQGDTERQVSAVQYVTNPTQGVAAGQAPPPGADVPAAPAGQGE